MEIELGFEVVLGLLKAIGIILWNGWATDNYLFDKCVEFQSDGHDNHKSLPLQLLFVALGNECASIYSTVT